MDARLLAAEQSEAHNLKPHAFDAQQSVQIDLSPNTVPIMSGNLLAPHSIGGLPLISCLLFFRSENIDGNLAIDPIN